jgi:putative DNA primase/helicase
MGDMTVDELKDKNLWFLWSAKPGKNGKVTKVPFAANGGATGTDDAHKGTWVSFDDAESARNQFQASGLGLKIPKGFFLLDIDHKDISDPFAQLMLSRFSSYAEVSPSSKGIHIIGQCDITKLPVHFDDRRKRLVLDSEYYQKRSDIGLELYIGDITNRYGTFTGNTINSLPIADCTQAVLTTLDKEMRKKPKAKYSAKRDGDRAVFDIVCDLRKQKNGDKFIRLYDKGDFSEYSSQSEADAALCALIAFRTGADPDAIDEVFRSSALYRSKWERDDYRENTINAGISACNGVFHRSKMEHPDFIKFNEQTGESYVSVPLLAKYVREHLQYILVRDNGKQGLLKYVYEGGCYRLYADNMLLGIIKKYIADYDEELVKMSKVNEVLLHITTDLTYVSQDALNADKDIINFQNGILKITATDTTFSRYTFHHTTSL